MRDPMYKTVCDRCYQGTWYESEGPCRRSAPKREPCGHYVGREGPCGGTLRVIDRSALASHFARYYESGQRIRVRFKGGGTLTGTVSKTTGWKPSYMLMLRSDSTGSPFLLGADDAVEAVKVGSKYVRTHYA